MHTFVAALMLLAALEAGPALEIKPSFGLDTCVWHATDVLAVDEGEVLDGKVTVTRVLAGTAKVGEAITLPGLARFAAAKERTWSQWFEPDTAPMVVSGRHLIVFLVRTASGFEGANRIARPGERLGISTVWLHDGKVFARGQWINPGPVTLHHYRDLTVASIESRVRDVFAAKARLAAAASIDDGALRASKILNELDSLPWEGRRACYTNLAACGSEAFDVVHRHMTEREQPNLRRDHFATLLTLDAARAVPVLTHVIESETTYFRRHKPRLQRGWWNDLGNDPKQVRIDRDHYSDLHRALEVLKHTKDDRLVTPVSATHRLWSSHPAYDDPSGLDQMTKACAKILANQR